MKKQNEEITIKELLDIFVPAIWVIAAVAVICAAILGGYSMFIKRDTYTSTASFVMVKIPTQYNENHSNMAITTGLSANEIEAMQSMISMTEQIMETDDYLTAVKEKLVEKNPEYSSVSLAELKEYLSIEIVGEATCFDLSAVTVDPQLSYDISDVVYHTLPEVIEDVFDSYSITIKIINAPKKALSANSKGVFRNAIIGGFAGALVTMLAVFVVSRLDVIIRNKEKIEQSFDIPILGLIPRFEQDN